MTMPLLPNPSARALARASGRVDGGYLVDLAGCAAVGGRHRWTAADPAAERACDRPHAARFRRPRSRRWKRSSPTGKRRTGNQLAVLMVPTTQPEPIEAYSIRVAETWKIGRKGKDNGVLFLVAKNDKKMRIEVGYGLEGMLTDVTSRRIIAENVAPLLRGGQVRRRHRRRRRPDHQRRRGGQAVAAARAGERQQRTGRRRSTSERCCFFCSSSCRSSAASCARSSDGSRIDGRCRHRRRGRVVRRGLARDRGDCRDRGRFSS